KNRIDAHVALEIHSWKLKRVAIKTTKTSYADGTTTVVTMKECVKTWKSLCAKCFGLAPFVVGIESRTVPRSHTWDPKNTQTNHAPHLLLQQVHIHSTERLDATHRKIRDDDL